MKKIPLLTIFFFVFCTAVFAQKMNTDSSALNIVSKQRDTIPIYALQNEVSLVKDQSLLINNHFNDGQLNILDGMKARWSGVSVYGTSGMSYAAQGIRIRGSNSFLNDNGPLFLIDGMPVTNLEMGMSISSVDQSNRMIDFNAFDFESIEILKGPSGSSIYGLRSGAGVVRLSTKIPKTQKPEIKIYSSLSINSVNKLPALQKEYSQGISSGGELLYLAPSVGSSFSWGPPVNSLEFDGMPTPFDENGTLVPQFTGNGIPANVYDPTTFFVNGLSFRTNASVSAWIGKLGYRISGGGVSSKDPIPTSRYRRSNFHTKLIYNVNEKIELSANGFINTSQANRTLKGSSLSSVMLGLLRTPPTFDNGKGKSGWAAVNDPDVYVLPTGGQRSFRGGIYDNPYYSVNQNFYTDQVKRFVGNVAAKYEINNLFYVNFMYGVDLFEDNRREGRDVNAIIGFSGNIIETDVSFKAQHSDLSIQTRKIALFNTVSVNGQLGINYYSEEHIVEEATGVGLISAGDFELSSSATINNSRTKLGKSLFGLYNSLEFNFDDLVLLNLNARNDWSAMLKSSIRDFLTYDAKITFQLSSIKGFGFKDGASLNLYGAYGRMARDVPLGINIQRFLPSIINGDPFLLDNASLSGFALEANDVLVNSLLNPEQTIGLEFGLEFISQNKRIGGKFALFDQHTKDVILIENISPSSGFFMSALNTSEINNNGIELDFWMLPVNKPTFKWIINVNFTKIKSLVSNVPESLEDQTLVGFTGTQSRMINNEPYSTLWGDQFQRDENGSLIIGGQGYPFASSESGVLGNPNPDWTAGIYNTFLIGGKLEIQAQIDIRRGGDMWCGTCQTMDYFGTSERTGELREASINFEGVDQQGNSITSTVPYADIDQGYTNYYWVRYGFGGIAEDGIFDTSWIRLRRLNISYDLTSFFKKFDSGLEVNVSVFANNLILITDYPGVDPETNLTGTSNGFGIDYYNNPGTRSYGTSISLNF